MSAIADIYYPCVAQMTFRDLRMKGLSGTADVARVQHECLAAACARQIEMVIATESVQHGSHRTCILSTSFYGLKILNLTVTRLSKRIAQHGLYHIC